MKVFISPTLESVSKDNGVGQVVHAQYKYLPSYGIELVSTPYEADITAAHIWTPLKGNDVLHSHGLEWTGDRAGYENWHGEVNQVILETAKQAWDITVPSEWVGMAFKRDMRLSPTVIGHGLELEEWQALPISDRSNYLLWNKNRQDLSCDPQAAIELARRGLPVVTTFGEPRLMQVTGPLPHAEMKQILRSAGVYLSTARETFGIGILEALACGVPVLGYAIGGASDLVEHKRTGYLVEPGDIDGLAEGYHWLMENRADMQGAIFASVANKDWRSIIGRYARLYEEVLKRKSRPRKVSVVMTCYNYGQFVGQAIESVLNQTMPVELIVVDDSSGPETHAVLEGYRVGNEKVNISYNSINVGVAESRNRGIGLAGGGYVVCLDADDYLEPAYIETLYKAMEADRSLGVAYTGLRLHFENGENSISPWPPRFDFDAMAKPGLPPPNSIPCAAMFRKDMWERAGGYRQEYAPGEDVEFWLRGLSVGFNAKKVTDEPLFNYRLHGGSASRTKQYKDITADKPWVRDKNLMPMAAPTKRANLIRSYSEPLVSVIIPVGPGHAKHLNKALDSLVAQTFKGWEAIVIDDTNAGGIRDAFELKSYPFVRSLQTLGRGAGAARNDGIETAKAPLLFFLDADDYLMPTALEKLVRAYTENKATFVFSDWYAANPGKPLEHMNCPEYSQEAVREKIQHAVSVLIEIEAVRQVGGFDEKLATWEDWDFFLKLASRGYCGVRVPEPLLVYRTETGTRRLKAFEPGSTVYQTITDRWKGVKFMPCCGQSAKIERVAVDMLAFPVQSSDVPDGKIRLRYVGNAKAGVTYLGKYQVADDPLQNTADVNPEEVSKLLQLGVFQEV